MSSERTEGATPRRLAEIRRRGQVARSAELNTAVTLLVGVVALQSLGGQAVASLQGFMRATFERPALPGWETPAVHGHAAGLTLWTLALLAPIVGLLMVGGLVSNFVQAGALFTLQPLAPQLSRIDPIQGLRRMWSGRSWVELLKALLKVAVIGGVMLQGLDERRGAVLMLAGMPLDQGLTHAAGLMNDLAMRATAALLGVAALDYGYQRWRFERESRMSRDDLKEELRTTEGSPELRAWLRQRARSIASGRMMHAVPTADVVLTNPTHLAVALRYEPASMTAPRVVAKGQRLVAERIKQVAREAGVQIVENKPLARALFQAVEIGEEIPATLYQAVAEVLAFIYRLKRPGGGRA